MLIYKLLAPENRKVTKEYTYAEEVIVKDGIAICRTPTCRQNLEARGYKLIAEIEVDPTFDLPFVSFKKNKPLKNRVGVEIILPKSKNIK